MCVAKKLRQDTQNKRPTILNTFIFLSNKLVYILLNMKFYNIFAPRFEPISNNKFSWNLERYKVTMCKSRWF
jgi:hypothetical protein